MIDVNGNINYNLSGTISSLNNVAPTSSELSALNDVLSELDTISGKHDNFLGNALSDSSLTDLYSSANSSYTGFIGNLQEFSAMWGNTDQTSIGGGVGSGGAVSSNGGSGGGGVRTSGGSGGVRTSGGSMRTNLGSVAKIKNVASLSGSVTGAFKSAVPVAGLAAVSNTSGTIKKAISKITSDVEQGETDRTNVSKVTNSSENKTVSKKINGLATGKSVVSKYNKKAVSKINGVLKKATNISGLQKLSAEKVNGGLASVANNTEVVKSLGETLLESGKNGLSQSGVLNLGTIKPGQAITTAKSASALPATMLAILSSGVTAGGGYVLTKKKNSSDISIDEYQA